MIRTTVPTSGMMLTEQVKLTFEAYVFSINERNHNMSVPARVKVTLFVADLDSISETSLDYKTGVDLVELIDYSWYSETSLRYSRLSM